MASIAMPPGQLSYHDRTGVPVWEEPLGPSAGYAWPSYSAHRGKLYMMLLAAVRERLGPDAIRTRFLDRTSGEPTTEDAELLTGADGIDSAVRAQRCPTEGPNKELTQAEVAEVNSHASWTVPGHITVDSCPNR